MIQPQTPAGVAVHGGFPNPATDSTRHTIDLNKQLIQHSVATYFMRVEGNLWQDLGIFANDVLIIDRALQPRTNDLVIWWEGESFCLGSRASLPPDCECWGVVTSAIHQFVNPAREH